jgi:hypothetical protein
MLAATDRSALPSRELFKLIFVGAQRSRQRGTTLEPYCYGYRQRYMVSATKSAEMAAPGPKAMRGICPRDWSVARRSRYGRSAPTQIGALISGTVATQAPSNAPGLSRRCTER